MKSPEEQESGLEHKRERRLPCVSAVDFGGATGSRWGGGVGGRIPGGIPPVNHNLCAKSAFTTLQTVTPPVGA